MSETCVELLPSERILRVLAIAEIQAKSNKDALRNQITQFQTLDHSITALVLFPLLPSAQLTFSHTANVHSLRFCTRPTKLISQRSRVISEVDKRAEDDIYGQ